MDSTGIKHPADWDELQKLSGLLYGSSTPLNSVHSTENYRHHSYIQFLLYCISKFSAISISTPIENALVLKQVQYVPSDTFIEQMQSSDRYCQTSPRIDPQSDKYDRQSTNDTCLSDDGSSKEDQSSVPDIDDDQSYFDAEEYAAQLNDSLVESTLHRTEKNSILQSSAADASGYLLQTSFSDDDPTRPQYQLPILDTGTLDTIFRILLHNDEGFTSLWKGNNANFLRDLLFAWTQPTTNDVLASFLNIPLDDIQLSYSENPIPQAGLLLASHAICGVLFSPLELIQTRQIVQTSSRYHRKYRYISSTLYTVLREEFPDKPFGIFFSCNLLFPTLAFHTLNPIFKFLGPLIIDRGLGLDQQESPFSYLFCEMAFGLLELIVMLPIETVRKRLMCQVVRRMPHLQPNPQKLGMRECEYKTVVQTSPVPYVGILDCVYRIIIEEGGPRSSKRNPTLSKQHSRFKRNRQSTTRFKKQSDEWNPIWRVSGLYRGISARLVASISVAILQTIVRCIEINYE
ncbi:hypothetical protein BATDEDRAFT_92293 [Batrachochytrium dendrobatidis JAM81]|uniref:Mitochondrial carrier n=2 Tax=Batrachochytrium dendrobatidis TaxID=109871 RepID=F4PCU7_BATDJ|nr:uncharacterized protein BATDEDRAFT_92293 [Batrachochytrium dendrobatidis JAM81]EGF76891.1 hypothetical protein BATDEDRAFT_92293 [Batrachochytrium dendrobatidis JAM81]OAJ44905.1 hypothetical protein BDEG_28088 [Batrachochytrium dendrobatidis JEL423]|eukprot:XP_006682490.1 hypothetical protein BATDEDRAFT_92293 [Batrachochytrium dendrobatidis JAM81]